MGAGTINGNERIFTLKNYLLRRWVWRDLANVLRYGFHSSKFGKRIYINPRDIKRASTADFHRSDSGKIVDGNWDRMTTAIEDVPKISIVYRKFEGRISWGEAGAVKLMKDLVQLKPGTDGCYSETDIHHRYELLDALIKYLRHGGEFLSREDLGGFREVGGIYVHIGRTGEVLFGGGGAHRLAIAQKLGLQRVPVQVGVTHKDYVKNRSLWERKA